MPTADLRALAERLGMLRHCECASGCERCDCGNRTYRDVCYRLPTEAEVRAAIREAGHFWVEVGANEAFAGVQFGGDERWRLTVTASEAAPDDLVVLALLRALEVARGD